MTNQNNIRLGNAFLYGDDMVYVSAIFKSHFNCERVDGILIGNSAQNRFVPIPLTKKMFEKLKFNDVLDGSFVKQGMGDNFEFRIYVPDKIEDRDQYEFWGSFDKGSSIYRIRHLGPEFYLHDLQNLYEFVTGRKLNV